MKITPNQITLARIILIPVIIFFYLSSSFIYCGKLISAGFFAIACLTDFLDGYLARKHNMVTDLGKFLDSIADKLLVVCGFILIVADNTILAPYGVVSLCIIVAREFIVSALRQIGATKQVVIQADMWGKVKANFQFFDVLFFMIYSFFITNNTILSSAVDLTFFIICYALLVVTVFATIVSGIHYLVAFKDVFHEDKKKDNLMQNNKQNINKENENKESINKETNIENSKQEKDSLNKEEEKSSMHQHKKISK